MDRAVSEDRCQTNRGEAALIDPSRSRARRSTCLIWPLLHAVARSVRHGAEVIPPKPAGYFNDYANVVSKGRRCVSTSSSRSSSARHQTRSWSLSSAKWRPISIEDYTQRVAQSWGVGQQDKRNGAVLFVFVDDRKMFIQVGYGLEGVLPDVTAFDITERHIKPKFKQAIMKAGSARASI